MNFFTNRMSLRNVLHLRNTIVLLMAGAFLSSCANMTERQRMYAEPVGGGVVIGAAAGAAACEDNRAAGAALGGALGGTLGYFIGDRHANRIGGMDQRSGHREQTISGLQQQNAVMARYNDRLKRTIDQYQRDINRNIDRRRSVGEELRKAQNAYNGLLSVLARERQAAARISIPNQRMAYENQLRKLEGEIQKLNYAISKLQGMSGQGRVGY